MEGLSGASWTENAKYLQIKVVSWEPIEDAFLAPKCDSICIAPRK